MFGSELQCHQKNDLKGIFKKIFKLGEFQCVLYIRCIFHSVYW